MHVSLRSTSALALTAGLLAVAGLCRHGCRDGHSSMRRSPRSVLSREEQEAEMQWFIDAAQPFRAWINVGVRDHHHPRI
jgi:glycerol transport system substrate-binding protein